MNLVEFCYLIGKVWLKRYFDETSVSRIAYIIIET